jgi:hypothetical protein
MTRTCLFSAVFVWFSINANAQSVTKFSWLVGEWVSQKDGLTTTEMWSLRNDSTLIGTSITVNAKNELVFEEALRIQATSDGTKYIAILPTKTAIFKLKSSSNKSISFIDPKNDFPSLISYTNTPNGIQVSLQGKGNKEVMDFVKTAN